MTDPRAELRAAIQAALEASSAVTTAFATKPKRIYGGMPPTDAPMPYVLVPDITSLPDEAEGIDAAETDVQISVWSRSDPPGYAEIDRISAAVVAVCLGLGDTASFRMMGAWVLTLQTLQDMKDAQAAHGVIRIRFATDAL